jgi:hypothetical protein
LHHRQGGERRSACSGHCLPYVILVTPREKGNSPVRPLFGLIGVLIKVIKRKKERETFASMSFEDLNKVAIDRIKIDEIETARVVPGFGPSQALEIVSNQRTSFLRNDPKNTCRPLPLFCNLY